MTLSIGLLIFTKSNRRRPFAMRCALRAIFSRRNCLWRSMRKITSHKLSLSKTSPVAMAAAGTEFTLTDLLWRCGGCWDEVALCFGSFCVSGYVSWHLSSPGLILNCFKLCILHSVRRYQCLLMSLSPRTASASSTPIWFAYVAWSCLSIVSKLSFCLTLHPPLEPEQ